MRRSRELERQVAERTAELAQERESAAVTAERNRLARELHDSATQSLYAVTLYADAATRLVSSGQMEMRHAQARCISVSLGFEPEAARLEVADDGIGFDPPAARKRGGLGLRGMEGRAEEMGGTWSVDSRPGMGTTVIVAVPRRTEPGEVAP